MKISFPFNVTNIKTGEVLPQTKAFDNKHAIGYEVELEHARRLGVPRAKKGSDGFMPLLCAYPLGVKWAYTVFRELYIVPEFFKRDEIPHSIAAANHPVFCAGLAFYAENGNVVTVNNWTGHYQVPVVRAKSDILEAWADCGCAVHIGELIG